MTNNQHVIISGLVFFKYLIFNHLQKTIDCIYQVKFNKVTSFKLQVSNYKLQAISHHFYKQDKHKSKFVAIMESISFTPIINKNSKVLILGTMPGIKSLEESEYYGNKRNAFWSILFNLFNEEMTEDYGKKKEFILKHKLALWDTLKQCYREGSLDSKIKNEAPNAIHTLITNYNSIKYIIFNGKGAEKFYKRYFKPIKEISYITLASTSPANAQKTFDQKLKEWAIIKEFLNN